MWREGIFVETSCLSLWMNPLGSSQNSSWHQSEADPSWPYTTSKNTSGDYVHHFISLSTPNYHAQPEYGLHSPSFWLDPISWSSGQVAEHTFSMVVKISEMKALEILLRCHHCSCSIHLVFLAILYGNKNPLCLPFVAGTEKGLNRTMQRGIWAWRTAFYMPSLRSLLRPHLKLDQVP